MKDSNLKKFWNDEWFLYKFDRIYSRKQIRFWI